MNTLLSLIETIAAARRPARMLPVEQVLDAVASRRFSMIYHPVVDQDGMTIAWRAKSGFWGEDGQSLSPSIVFALLHETPALLLATELQLKSLAMTYAPAAGRLILSLDADSYAAARQSDGNPFDRLFAGQSRVVVEVCENRPMMDVARLRYLLRCLSVQGIPLAAGRHTPVAIYRDDSFGEMDWVRVPCPPDWRDAHRIRAMAGIAEAAWHADSIAYVSDVQTPEALALIYSIGFAAASGPVFSERTISARPALSGVARGGLRVGSGI